MILNKIKEFFVLIFLFFLCFSVYADQTFGGNVTVNGFLAVKGKAITEGPAILSSLVATGSASLVSANLSGSLAVAGPSGVGSLTTSGSSLVLGALTVTGSTTLSNGISFLGNNGLNINGSLILGSNGVLMSAGAKRLGFDITTTPTAVLTVNFTTTTGCSLVRFILFGSTGAGDLKYDATFFMGTSNSALEDSTISLTGGRAPLFNISYAEVAGSVSLVMSTVSGAILSPSIFYEACGNRISSII